MKNTKWIAMAILVLALGAAGILFGWNLLPTGEAAEAKGTYAPWLGTWIMIWAVFGITVTLAGFLFVVGTGKTRG
jgi:heme/copper-type cytochrome/quinol oxidase subunit 2